MVAQSIVDYYDHMNLIYSFECFLIIADTKIKRHEKVKKRFTVRDDPECNEFQKTAKHAINPHTVKSVILGSNITDLTV